MRQLTCYSAGPDLFPRTLPDGRRETWEDAQERVRSLAAVIEHFPCFKVIYPSNGDLLTSWPATTRPRACLYRDLLYATQSDIVFANVTPFGGREPDSGTVVEAVACVLSGGLLVLWSDPLTTFAAKYADADVHPESDLDLHYNLMLEQLYYWSWEAHFGSAHDVFGSLASAAISTSAEVRAQGDKFRRIPLLDRLNHASCGDLTGAIQHLLDQTWPH